MRYLVAIFSLIFGVMTLVEGGAVLFVNGAAREAAGNYLSFVLWFNFFTGFAFLVLAIGILKRFSWGPRLALAVSILSIGVLIAFWISIARGVPYETRTWYAMPFRTMLWLGLAMWCWRQNWACTLALALVLSGPLSVVAAESRTEEINEPMTVSGKALVLNGSGFHTATIFRIEAKASVLCQNPIEDNH